jgi:hypothetical protein
MNPTKMPMEFDGMSVFDAFAPPPPSNDTTQMQAPLIPMVPVMLPQQTITEIPLDQQAILKQHHANPCMVGACVVIFTQIPILLNLCFSAPLITFI